MGRDVAGVGSAEVVGIAEREEVGSSGEAPSVLVELEEVGSLVEVSSVFAVLL